MSFELSKSEKSSPFPAHSVVLGHFQLSCLVLFFVCYFFIASSIGNSRSAIKSKVIEYRDVFAAGGLTALDRDLSSQVRCASGATPSMSAFQIRRR
jgi:hypothetical protein